MGNEKQCTDHKGIVYKSKKEMAEAYGISLRILVLRESRGYTLEKCLTGIGITDRTECTDHKGIVYKSQNHMARAYDIEPGTLRARLKSGWTLEKALTTPSLKTENPCTDHKGTVYKSEADMVRAYNITLRRFHNRIKNGWSLEEALTKKNHKLVVDHLGNKYKNLEEMVTKYHISKHIYVTRLEAGWSLEKTLTTPIGVKSCEIKLTGSSETEYVTAKEISNRYNIPYCTVLRRKDKGYTTAEIIGAIPLIGPKIRNKKISENLLILKPVKDEETNIFYFHCIHNNNDTVYSRNELLEKCKEELRLVSL